LIGIVCPDAIVLAADSQITHSGLGSHVYFNKITTLDSRIDQLLIAQAGLPGMSNRVIEIMRDKLRAIQIGQPREIAQIAEDSVREAKKNLDREQKKYGKDYGAELMLAFYAGSRPYLYTIDVYGTGIANPSDNDYATAGIGKYVANYLLSEIAEPKEGAGIAISTCIYVIKKIKEHQKSYCGGETNIKWLWQVPVNQTPWKYVTRAMDINKDFLQLMEQNLFELDEANKKARNKQVLSILQETGNKITEQWRRNGTEPPPENAAS
ncbi:MAG TPA: hypothetical protein VNV43_07070, partial [Candidatus Acidoferrales bacterium]|nr:hypothetical protein [Candidatus Acidoferrales bacterium]